MNKRYDLAIIGSGPGGYVAGLYASRHKLNVCVIEKGLVGGTCLNKGCIPTKVMLNSSSLLSRIRESRIYGVEVDGFKLNFANLTARKEEVVSKLRTGIETLFRANKIDLVRGSACLKDENTVTVDGQDVVAKYIIIATGSSPLSLPGIKPDEKNIFSSDGILEIKALPKSILIIGAGAVGCEFATIFSSFGVKVTIVELLERVLMTQSREASKKLEAIFKKKNVDIFTSSKVESITKGGLLEAKLSTGRVVEAEKALLAVGRGSNIEGIGIEKLGIKTEKGRISTDESLRTNVKNIYAIGDCIGGPLLAHKASYDGILACDNVLGKDRRADYSNIPNCVYTEPEVASVGLNEEEAKTRYPSSRVAKFPYLGSGKASILGRPEGFIKIIGDRDGRILGIEIMGEEACDLIGEAVLAKTAGVNIKDLSMVVHGHPTLSEIFQEAAHIFCGTGIHSI